MDMTDAAGTGSSLGTRLKRAEQAMLRAKNAVLKPIGLTLAQYVALGELEREPGVTAATLSRACQVSPQAMMILLKAMEQQGLVARAAHPRHPNVLEVHITEVGRSALHEGRILIQPVEQRVWDEFSPTELKLFDALLVRFARAIDASQRDETQR
jgi:DNA-binding MarR family transcriptional regulator